MSNNIGNISSTNNNGNPTLTSDNSIFCSSFYFESFFDDKQIKSFIKNTEKMIRESNSYKEYISLLRAYSDLSKDNINSNVTTNDTVIEFHHYPLNLYMIVETVMNYHVIRKEKFNSFMLAKEILQLHFDNKIGLVPLHSTNHQLAHLYKIFISDKQIFGNWREFIKEYETGLTPAATELLEKFDQLNASGQATDYLDIYK